MGDFRCFYNARLLQVLEDWRYIAMVIDRLQLYLFLAVTIGGSAAIHVDAPYIVDFVDQEAIKKRIGGGTDGIG